MTLSLRNRMIIGAIAGLAVVAFLLFAAGAADPAWGKYWMIRPIIVLTFAGAMAGLCNYIILHYRHLAGLHRIVAIIISLVVSLVGIWMGIVLGFDGTLWN